MGYFGTVEAVEIFCWFRDILPQFLQILKGKILQLDCNAGPSAITFPWNPRLRSTSSPSLPSQLLPLPPVTLSLDIGNSLSRSHSSPTLVESSLQWNVRGVQGQPATQPYFQLLAKKTAEWGVMGAAANLWNCAETDKREGDGHEHTRAQKNGWKIEKKCVSKWHNVIL